MDKQKNISPFPKENIFKTPENYFEHLEENILSKAGVQTKHLSSKNTFSTPENYFENLSQDILTKAKSASKNRAGLDKRNSIKLGVFTILLVVILMGLFSINKNNNKATLAKLGTFAEGNLKQITVVSETNHIEKEKIDSINIKPIPQHQETLIPPKQKIVEAEEQIVLEQKNHLEELDDTLIKEYIESIDISEEEWLEFYELESPSIEIDFIESEIDDTILLEELNKEEKIEEYLWSEQF